MRRLLSITKALSDQNRIRILCALSSHGELCVCQIQELLGLAASSTSKHLSVLATAGLLEARKQGRWAYYRITSPSELQAGCCSVLDWLLSHAAQERIIIEDGRKLKAILAHTPEELCQIQASGKRCCSSAPETPAAARSPKATREP